MCPCNRTSLPPGVGSVSGGRGAPSVPYETPADAIFEPPRCAIAVCTQAGQQLGYIGYHQSRELAAEIDAGRRVTCEVVRVTGGRGWLFRRRYGVNVRLVIA